VIFDLEPIVTQAVAQNASDIHFSPGMPIFFRIDGRLIPQPGVLVTHQMIEEWHQSLPVKIQNEVKTRRQSDFSLMMKAGTRLRGNLFYQQRGLSAAFRVIPSDIRPFDSLGLPNFVREKIRSIDHGMILVVGPTGHGKSTTLAALIQDKLSREDVNIITIEDPVEYVYKANSGRNSLVSQRQVGNDVLTFKDGIKAALREDPDLLMVGEMRDYLTVSAALTMAETGHILFSTLHSNTGAETIARIIDSFPGNQQNQVRSQLAMNLEMVISQRLVPAIGGGRVLAYEIMTNSYAIATKIRENKLNEIGQVFETSVSSGEMISLERCLAYLYKAGKITREVAMDTAPNKDKVQALMEYQG